MKCALCKNKAEIGVIVKGKYLKLCLDCKPLPKVSSGYAEWERGRDLEDHQFDVLQPYGANGKPNPDFIKAYPKQARAVFTDEQINDTLRR